MRGPAVMTLGAVALLAGVLAAVEGLWASTVAMVGVLILVGIRLRADASASVDRRGVVVRGGAAVAVGAVVIAVVIAFRNDWD